MPRKISYAPESNQRSGQGANFSSPFAARGLRRGGRILAIATPKRSRLRRSRCAQYAIRRTAARGPCAVGVGPSSGSYSDPANCRIASRLPWPRQPTRSDLKAHPVGSCYPNSHVNGFAHITIPGVDEARGKDPLPDALRPRHRRIPLDNCRGRGAKADDRIRQRGSNRTPVSRTRDNTGHARCNRARRGPGISLGPLGDDGAAGEDSDPKRL